MVWSGKNIKKWSILRWYIVYYLSYFCVIWIFIVFSIHNHWTHFSFCKQSKSMRYLYMYSCFLSWISLTISIKVLKRTLILFSNLLHISSITLPQNLHLSPVKKKMKVSYLIGKSLTTLLLSIVCLASYIMKYN